ncbi:MAG: DUF4180 domain-containing protein [Clostridiales bacterium]|nr:DUF4180 domain-containing protein [Clostridiales bacterium]
MSKRVINMNGINIAVINSDEIIISDVQSALDLIATVGFEDHCERIAINKEAIIEGFFKLSTGIAGEILQKFENYRKKIAIYGDFSGYTSKPLKDFIYECNKGNAVFFLPEEQSAISRLAQEF